MKQARQQDKPARQLLRFHTEDNMARLLLLLKFHTSKGLRLQIWIVWLLLQCAEDLHPPYPPINCPPGSRRQLMETMEVQADESHARCRKYEYVSFFFFSLLTS